jgi:hypothetical protein
MPVNVKLLLCLAAITIGGCSGASVRLNAEYNRSTYDHLNFSLYHADRDTKVVVHGNPFAMASADFGKAVTGHMQGANFGRRSNFTTTPGKSAERNLRVVMAFNAAEDDTYDLCGGKVDTRTSKGAMRLSAAWCFGDRQDSFVEAEVNGAGGINDPRFRALIQQTVLNLFPTHMDRELFGDDNGDDSPKGG